MGEPFLAGGLYFVSYIFDAIDGKVARITNRGTPYGAWFDIAIDRINLTLISLAISWRYFTVNEDVFILVLNLLFLALTFIGSESRHQIDVYKQKVNYQDDDEKSLSSYAKWCLKNGVEKEPISLPELFLFLLIVAPQFQWEKITFIIVIFFLLARLVKQQFFWFHVTKNR
jgi:phosphatidylserine synthase